MDFTTPTILGRTGLAVGRLGVASSYGAPAAAFEEAFERGCNYFYWGSLRRGGMARALRNLCGQGRRGDLVVVIQSYSRFPALLEASYTLALRRLGLEYGDVLLLGWFSQPPAPRLWERALDLQRRGLVRFLAFSGHRRSLFPELARQGLGDIFHIRYNAAHRGAEIEAFAPLAALPSESRPGIVTYTATRWGQLLKTSKMPPGETPASAADCYRFALSHPAVNVCLTGPATREQMRQALRALDLGPLNEDELQRLRRIGDWLHG